MDDIAIMKHLRRKYTMVVFPCMAETLLQTIRRCELSLMLEDMIEIAGRDAPSDIPQVILVPVKEFLACEERGYH